MKISIKQIIEYQQKHRLSVLYTLILVLVCYAFFFEYEAYLSMYKSIEEISIILLMAVLAWISTISESIEE